MTRRHAVTQGVRPILEGHRQFRKRSAESGCRSRAGIVSMVGLRALTEALSRFDIAHWLSRRS